MGRKGEREKRREGEIGGMGERGRADGLKERGERGGEWNTGW